MRSFAPPLLVFVVLGVGCARFAAEQTINVAKIATPALEQEGDYELAAAGIPGNLKFLEGIAAVIPDNTDLLELLTRGFGSYAFGFVEEAAYDARLAGDEKKSDHLTERAVGLFERAGHYGLKLLGQQRGFDAAFKKGGSALHEKLQELTDKKQAGPLFWTANAWFGAINLAQDKVENLALLPKVLQLVQRAAQLDEGYYFGGPHLILGGYQASLPKALGGKPEKAREHFEKAIALSEGKALLPKVMLAHMYATKVGDKALFTKLLKEVEEASLDALPAARLPNVIAKRKAARLMKRMSDLF